MPELYDEQMSEVKPPEVPNSAVQDRTAGPLLSRASLLASTTLAQLWLLQLSPTALRGPVAAQNLEKTTPIHVGWWSSAKGSGSVSS